MPCTLPHIPERLHANGRENIDEFYIDEFLFRRCKEEDKHNPFDKISLVDLSVNRQGTKENPLSIDKDVLFNTVADNGKGEILDEAISYLKIAELNDEQQYRKEKSHSKTVDGEDVSHICEIRLKHKKEECNYAHCAFEVYYDGIEMTYKNYKTYLGKDTVLRSWAKTEIAKMIVKEEIWINWPNEVTGKENQAQEAPMPGEPNLDPEN